MDELVCDILAPVHELVLVLVRLGRGESLLSDLAALGDESGW